MRTVIFFAAIFLFAGCSPKIDARVAEDTDFSKYRTFDFHDTEVDNQTDKVNPGGMEALKTAIERELNAWGIQRSSTPNMLFNIGVVVTEKEQTRETTIQEAPVYMGQRSYHWESEEVVVDTYEQGTLVLKAFVPETNTMLWQASGDSILPKKVEKISKNLDEGVANLFKTFPK